MAIWKKKTSRLALGYDCSAGSETDYFISIIQLVHLVCLVVIIDMFKMCDALDYSHWRFLWFCVLAEIVSYLAKF